MIRSKVDDIARNLCNVAAQVLDHAYDDVWATNWDYEDESALHEAADAIKAFRRWEKTGTHPFEHLRAGLEPQLALADQIARRLDTILAGWEKYGQPLDETLIAHATDVLRDYARLRAGEWRSWKGS